MKIVILKCPKCECGFHFKNYWHWVWKAPFHTFTKRLTKCPHCGEKSYMKRESK